MGFADLIHQRVQTLTEQKQAEVYDFVEFIAARNPSSLSDSGIQKAVYF